MAEVLGQIDRYELVREIGRGGMATVFLARQTGLKRLVALKRLNGVQLGDGNLAERFARESQLTAQLAHERIVTVHDYFEVDGTPFIAMEYLPGGSLRPHVKRLTHDQALALLDDILEGLRCAEANSVVHRDLKPENVLLTTDGHAKIADFGIAKAIGELTGATGLTATGLALGTPTYMAPEQALGRPVTPATDRYALGVIAYELVTGAAPFVSDDSPIALLYQHVNQDPPSLEGAPGVDEAMSALDRPPARQGPRRAVRGQRGGARAPAPDPAHGDGGRGAPRRRPPGGEYETWSEPRRPTPDPVVVPPPEDQAGVDTPVGEVVELADTSSALGFVPAVPEPAPAPEPAPEPVADREEEPSAATEALTAAPQRPLPPPPATPDEPEDPGRRRRRLPAAAALAATAVVAAIVFLLVSSGDDGGQPGGQPGPRRRPPRTRTPSARATASRSSPASSTTRVDASWSSTAARRTAARRTRSTSRRRG